MVCKEALNLGVVHRREKESGNLFTQSLPASLFPLIQVHSLENYYISSCLNWPLSDCAGEQVSFPEWWCFIKFQRWSGSGNRWGADSKRKKEGGQGLHSTMQEGLFRRHGDRVRFKEGMEESGRMGTTEKILKKVSVEYC